MWLFPFNHFKPYSWTCRWNTGVQFWAEQQRWYQQIEVSPEEGHWDGSRGWVHMTCMERLRRQVCLVCRVESSARIWARCAQWKDRRRVLFTNYSKGKEKKKIFTMTVVHNAQRDSGFSTLASAQNSARPQATWCSCFCFEKGLGQRSIWAFCHLNYYMT